MLSNARARPTMTIALLQNTTMPFKEYFDDVQPIFWEHQGRPHWGKKHTLKAPELAELYPEWDAFGRIRRRMDPDGVFMNDYLRELFGEEEQ